MTGIRNFMEGYNNFMKTYQDPRTTDWFLSGKPGHLFLILGTYLYFCKSAGPRFMRDRKPFELKRTIQIYNLIQVLLSMYLVYEGLMSGWLTDYTFKCQPVVQGEKGLRMAKAVWFYFFCKLIELLDTVFFILRKKYNQVSYLHIYHHTLMPICAWIGVTFIPGGHGSLMGVINSFIHIIMYSYYLLSSLGPQYQKYLWWKKHLTALQMIQFCIIGYHNIQVFFRSCDYPKCINFLLALEAVYFLYLFGRFYYNQYIRRYKAKDSGEKKTANGITPVQSNGTSVDNNKNNISNGRLKAL